MEQSDLCDSRVKLRSSIYLFVLVSFSPSPRIQNCYVISRFSPELCNLHQCNYVAS
uniref:Uncharacterized protein n=1 Tax=Arundo donax TaxID=35708 RepID=A0A0A8XUU5_ARUDO